MSKGEVDIFKLTGDLAGRQHIKAVQQEGE